MAGPTPLLVPVQIDAFRLNEAACGDGSDRDRSTRIAPITQPNYTFLRLDNFVLQNDVLPHVDLHNSAPAARNPRLRDLSTMPTAPLRHRRGIYLHWTLPRCYRSGVSMADSAPDARRKEERDSKGLQTSSEGSSGGGGGQTIGSSTPGFIQPPTRWLIVRKLDVNSIEPPEARSAFKDKEYVAWVIESDFLWKLNDIPLDYDLQVDVSPFVTSSGTGVNTKQLMQQAEVFIGRRIPLEEWTDSASNMASEPPDISLIRSSNQLFADHQFHNANVFSMLDNFRYGHDQAPQYLSYAKASYSLVGWHRKDEVDPLWEASGSLDLEKRMSGLFMGFSGKTVTQDEHDWLKAGKSTRLLCHGAMYDVVWDDSKKPGTVPADDFARRLREPTVPAMSVGTTPIDALITYCTARKDKSNDRKAIQKLEEDILLIDSLLHARDDGVEGQREAKDTVYNWNFTRSAGGLHYYLAPEEKDGKPTFPEKATKDVLTEVNQMQLVQNACVRVLQQYRWDMFSRWWQYVSDARNTRKDDKKNQDYKTDTDKLAKHIDALQDIVDTIQDDIKKKIEPEPASAKAPPAVGSATETAATSSTAGSTAASGSKAKSETAVSQLLKVKSGTLPFFYRGRDPTVLVGGIDSGWALDYLDEVKARLPSETIESSTVPEALKQLVSMQITHKLPRVFNDAIKALMTEFWALRPDGGAPDTAPRGKSFPQFHDTLTADTPPMPAVGSGSTPAPPASGGTASTATAATSTTTTHSGTHGASKDAGGHDGDDDDKPLTLPRWRDRWSDRQPWFPLYVEWEVEYTHIPIDHWTLTEQAARLSDNKLVRYGIKESDDKEPLSKHLNGKLDQYVFSGRSLILPQPSFSLKAKIDQIYSDTPPKIRYNILEQTKFDGLRDHLSALSFLSAPLSGLTDGLVTLAQGTHIKPENKTLNENGVVNTEAIKAAEFDDAGLTLQHIGKIQNNSGLTPYAAVTRYNSPDFCPFKPVTHGQLRFRKFNIIDKFGQALVANDPKPTATGPPPVYPAISDWYEPQMYNKTTANTVIIDDDDKNQGLCEFMQLPPSINQNARLNASFVIRDKNDLKIPNRANWRPVSEWESPIWGWIVTNYADYGIQLFLPDGTFYREARIGGPNGTLTSEKWTPFGPDQSIVNTDTAQLDALITNLRNRDYLEAFWSMITQALDALPPAPTAYAGFLNSIVGKPLALANMGWSLELDGPAYTNQSTNAAKLVPNLPLLPKDPFDPFNKGDISYQFPIKLGDKERDYDGLVGYFELKDRAKGTELDLTTTLTYFPSPGKLSTTAITKDKYPVFKPYWIKPFVEQADPDTPLIRRDPADYENARNLAMQASGNILGAILDPFTAIHAYSSILPAKSLQLASWTWQDAMDKMTAFLHAGPYHTTADVPGFDVSRRLTTANMKNVPPADVAIPALPGGDWNWLQPYVDPNNTAESDPPAYNSFGLDRRGNLSRPGFQVGPYTALEGYLQLRNPIMQDPPKKQQTRH